MVAAPGSLSKGHSSSTSTSFTSLLARLAAEHERTVSEAVCLREENQRLLEQLGRLQSEKSSAATQGQAWAANDLAVARIGGEQTRPPELSPVQDERACTLLPGMPMSDLPTRMTSIEEPEPAPAPTSTLSTLGPGKPTAGNELGVRVLAGHGLQSWLHGLAVPAQVQDLFVVASVGEERQQTPVVQGSCDPVWSFPEFKFKVDPEDQVLELDVVNAKTESILGRASLEFRALTPWQCHRQRASVVNIDGGLKEAGSLDLEVCWRPCGEVKRPPRPSIEVRNPSLEVPAPRRTSWQVDQPRGERSQTCPLQGPEHGRSNTKANWKILKDGHMEMEPEHPAAVLVTPSPKAQRLVEKAIGKLEESNRMRQRERFLRMFNLSVKTEEDKGDELCQLWIRADDIVRVLHKRGQHDWDKDIVKEVVSDISRFQGSRQREDGGMEFSKFVDAMMAPDLPDRICGSDPRLVRRFQKIMNTVDVEEVIAKVTRLQQQHNLPEEVVEDKGAELRARILFYLNSIVSVTILLSILSLGVSLDFHPRHWAWIAVECVFGCVFVMELVIKLKLLGCRTFYTGPGATGNWSDTLITFITLLDLTISCIDHFNKDSLPDVSAAKVTLALRSLRLARIARLIKLFRGPLVKQLANMLSGFFIGIPSLMWVMVLLGFVIYMLALAARQTIGQEIDTTQDLRAKCGDGDNIITPEDPDCTQCALYTEEFVTTVLTTSFTVFRCIIGDCSSKGGQALTPHFSQCFGWKFDATYFICMVAVIFGLFNIITAIFVEATMQGLQFNNAQSKYANMYESNHMKKKLEALVRRVRFLFDSKAIRSTSSYGKSVLLTQTTTAEINGMDVLLAEDEFYRMLQDPEVSRLLEELDVVLDHRLNIFSMFDTSADGKVSLVEFIETLMKMRGEVQKCDLVASWATLEALREEIHDFQHATLANQRQLLNRQDRYLEQSSVVEKVP